ncbi:MAG: hypothetical protein P8R42_10715 [Candidatus Binatia bacterium]|nr:hypothetical protein [Candidatus Binatia bacterium]
MKWFVAMVMLVSVSLVNVHPAEAGRRYRRGNFWGGFAAGVLTSGLLAPRAADHSAVLLPEVVHDLK